MTRHDPRLSTTSKLLSATCLGLVVGAVALAAWGAFSLLRLGPGDDWPASDLDFAALAAALAVFGVGFVSGIVLLARLLGSRRPAVVAAGDELARLEQAA